jgi:NOL1/NOP2/fmu family ribosome biogenesis protein
MGRRVTKRSRRKDFEEKLRQLYGINELPAGVLMQAKGRYRFATVAAAELARHLKGVRSVGLALTGQSDGILTIEACQMLGPQLTKGVVELYEDQAQQWLFGDKVQLSHRPDSRFIAAKCGEDWLGGGWAAGTKVIPDLPSWRRLKALPEEKEK